MSFVSTIEFESIYRGSEFLFCNNTLKYSTIKIIIFTLKKIGKLPTTLPPHACLITVKVKGDFRYYLCTDFYCRQFYLSIEWDDWQKIWIMKFELGYRRILASNTSRRHVFPSYRRNKTSERYVFNHWSLVLFFLP